MGIGICPSRNEIALLTQSCEIHLAVCEIGCACDIFSYENVDKKWTFAKTKVHFTFQICLSNHPEGIPQHAHAYFTLRKQYFTFP